MKKEVGLEVITMMIKIMIEIKKINGFIKN